MKLVEHFLIASIETSCWKSHADKPPTERNEIIEIGVVPFSLKTLEIGNKTSYLIKPTISHISEFCTSITSITQELADTGMAFKDAIKRMEKELASKKLPWISWGWFDRKMLMMQCEHMEVKYAFGAGHWDASNMFAIMNGLDKEVGLATALKMFGLEFEGTRHRAADEAYNIARVVVEMFRRVRNEL